MLISTRSVLAIKCPDCGKTDLHTLTRFSFSGDSSVKIVCECGTNLITINKKGRNLFYLQVACLMCNTQHIYSLRAKDLWNNRIFTMICADTGMKIGFIGLRDEVIKCIQEEEHSYQQLVENLGCEEYFSNSDIMRRIIDLLKKMSKDGKLSCSVGKGI
jgi:ribosomal protein S27E